MYAKCGSIEDVQRVFNKMARRDVVTWNSKLLTYVKLRQEEGVGPISAHAVRMCYMMLMVKRMFLVQLKKVKNWL